MATGKATMLIEFVGCSGAGKTTFATGVHALLREKGIDSVMSSTVVARRTGTTWIGNARLRNVALSFLLLPWLASWSRRDRNTYMFALRSILGHEVDTLARMNRMRSVARQLSEGCLIRKEASRRVVLSDEGLSGIVHNVFVFSKSPPDLDSVRRFAALAAPPTDMIVHVRTPAAIALRRTVARPDPPIVSRNCKLLGMFIENGYQVFETFASSHELQSQLIRVEDPCRDALALRSVISDIAGRISDSVLSKEGRDGQNA